MRINFASNLQGVCRVRFGCMLILFLVFINLGCMHGGLEGVHML